MRSRPGIELPPSANRLANLALLIVLEGLLLRGPFSFSAICSGARRVAGELSVSPLSSPT
jgi:hypothetical protein